MNVCVRVCVRCVFKYCTSSGHTVEAYRDGRQGALGERVGARVPRELPADRVRRRRNEFAAESEFRAQPPRHAFGHRAGAASDGLSSHWRIRVARASAGADIATGSGGGGRSGSTAVRRAFGRRDVPVERLAQIPFELVDERGVPDVNVKLLANRVLR